MSGTASGLFMNVQGCTWTPTGGSALSLTEVTEADVDRGGDVKRWFADGSVYAKALKLTNQTRTVTIMGGNVAQLAQVVENVPGSVVIVFPDANNGTGAGAVTLTASNAVCTHNPFKGQQSEFGTGSLTFECYSTDGTTDPFVFVVAT